MLVSIGRIGSSGKGHAFLPQIRAAVLSTRAGTGACRYISARLTPGHSAQPDERTTAL